MSLKYEPASESLLIHVNYLVLYCSAPCTRFRAHGKTVIATGSNARLGAAAHFCEVDVFELENGPASEVSPVDLKLLCSLLQVPGARQDSDRDW